MNKIWKFVLGLVAALAFAGCANAVILSPQVNVVDLGNGTTTSFNYPFLVPFQSNGVTPAVLVQLVDSSGIYTNLAPSQYSITGVGNAAGGAVHYPLAGSPLPSGSKMTISRALSYIQPIVVNNTGFYPHTVEVSADNLDAQIQQLASGLSRALTFPPPEVGYQLPPAANRVNKFFGFDAGGLPFLYANSPAPGTADAYTTTYTAPFSGAVQQSVGAKLSRTVSVTDFGAVGNSATLDTAAFQAAITAACATTSGTGGVFEVDVPVLATPYTINAALNVCTNLHIHGIGGYAVINFTAVGSGGNETGLFTNTGQDNIEIDHLDTEGTSANHTWGYIAKTSVSSALNVRIHDNFFNNWGTTGGGGWIDLASDSGANAIYNNYGVANDVIIAITAPTDRLHVYDNLLTATNGICIAALNAASGAATILIDHNIFECELGGAMYLNTLGEWIVDNNEEETLNPLTNADSAVYDFSSVTLMQFSGNTSNSHAGANYDVYVHDAVTNSYFANLSAVSAVVSAYKVGSGLGNVYEYNNSGNGPSHVYNVDYPGIRTNQLYGGKGIAQGCGATTTGIIPNTFCREIEEISPGSSTTANFIALTPGLSSGQDTAFVTGQDFSTGNSAEFGTQWHGNNNSANRAYFGLSNGDPITVDVSGNASTLGTINATAGFKANAIAGVSCAANTVVLSTLVVTDGIVTHC